MAVFETEALVLRSYNLSDADKIVVFMTESFGLVRGVAKGAKRLKSRFGGGLESFSIVNLTYYQKEQSELVSIREIELERSFFKEAGNIEFLKKFEYLSELLIDFAPPHDPNLRLYNMSKVCLETASNNPDTLENIALYFELWILRLGGFLPGWENCSNCKKLFDEEQDSNLQTDFRLACHTCQNIRRNSFISAKQRQIYSVAQKVSPDKFLQMTNEYPQELREVSCILKRIISQVLGKEKVGEKILTAKF